MSLPRWCTSLHPAASSIQLHDHLALPPLSSQINTDPYAGGWIMKLKMSNKGDLSKLMDAAAYKAEISE
eukprot:353481-Chlamydomonas_euryale.AAC.5